MPWPAGDILSIVREAYGALGNIRATAAELGVAIGTVQDMLVNPGRSRQLSTLLQIQQNYQAREPRPEPGGRGTTRYPTNTPFASQLRDLIPPRGATGWHVIYKSDATSASPSGVASTGWRGLDLGDPADFIEGRGISAEDVIEIRFGTQTGP